MNPNKKALISEVYYPETDGKPMAETDVHRDLMAELIDKLQDYFRPQPDVYVSGNLLLYYVEGDPKKCVSPDAFVARGIGKHERRVYKLWEEQPPSVVIEISSRETWRDDLQHKWVLCEQFGVKEYFVFDPEYDYLVKMCNRTLLAYRLVQGEFVELETESGRVFSKEPGLELVDTGETLRLFNPQTGEFLPTRDEMRAAREQAEARAQAEAEARQRAEAELALLRKELEKLRSQ